MTYLYRALPRIRHDVNGLSVVRILSKTSTKRLRSVGDQADVGSTISFIFINVRFLCLLPLCSGLLNPFSPQAK